MVIGGGITGISLATLLARNGKSTVLVERKDFTSGTSQASGMMIWGGLLYLRNLEFLTVAKFCRSRDQLIKRQPSEVSPRGITYLVAKTGGRSSRLMWCALQFYRAISLWSRAPIRRFPLDQMPADFDKNHYSTGWTYEEGFLSQSDSGFALQQLTDVDGPLTALNYHEIQQIRRRHDGYDVTLRSLHGSTDHVMRVDKIVNCGGVWADEINQRFGISTRHHHHLSKGVYLLLDQTGDDAFVMDSGEDGDVLCWVPWGEVTMWGPTETTIGCMAEAHATAADVNWLLDQLNRRSTRRWSRADISNIRCGVRPLAKLPATKVRNPLDLSRKAVVEAADDQPWWTVFGGKLSGAQDVAHEIYVTLCGAQPVRCTSPRPPAESPMVLDYFHGRAVPKPEHCRDQKFCRTLEDYLRRRTNIAQWIPRGGFGRNHEFEPDLRAICARLHLDPDLAEQDFHRYRDQVTVEENHWYE